MMNVADTLRVELNTLREEIQRIERLLIRDLYATPEAIQTASVPMAAAALRVRRILLDHEVRIPLPRTANNASVEHGELAAFCDLQVAGILATYGERFLYYLGAMKVAA